MNLTLVAFTMPNEWNGFPHGFDSDADSGMDHLSEFAGRACYQSWSKPNPATASNADYMSNILAQKHTSILEHSSASFYVEGVSRNMLLELERHRHLSFSVLSQRFVAEDTRPDAAIVLPPAVRDSKRRALIEAAFNNAQKSAQTAYRITVTALMSEGLTRKQAREAARAVLPGGTETKFVVTGNLRAWRDVLTKRFSVHADAEIREFATAVLTHLRAEAPNAFQDFPTEPFED